MDEEPCECGKEIKDLNRVTGENGIVVPRRCAQCEIARLRAQLDTAVENNAVCLAENRVMLQWLHEPHRHEYLCGTLTGGPHFCLLPPAEHTAREAARVKALVEAAKERTEKQDCVFPCASMSVWTTECDCGHVALTIALQALAALDAVKGEVK